MKTNNLSFSQMLAAASASLRLRPAAQSKPRCTCHNKYLTQCPAQQVTVRAAPTKKTFRIKGEDLS